MLKCRFDCKKVIITKVSDGIKIPEELINRIEAGDAPVYHHTGVAASESSAEGESFGRKIYKHLMNGVSNMLPFTVAGGIFIALAFLITLLPEHRRTQASVLTRRLRSSLKQ